jgi:hypothetical protein
MTMLAAVASSSAIDYAGPLVPGQLSDFLHGLDKDIPCCGRRGRLNRSFTPSLAKGVVIYYDGVTMVAVEGCDALVTFAESVIHVTVTPPNQIDLKLVLSHNPSGLKPAEPAATTAT